MPLPTISFERVIINDPPASQEYGSGGSSWTLDSFSNTSPAECLAAKSEDVMFAGLCTMQFTTINGSCSCPEQPPTGSDCNVMY